MIIFARHLGFCFGVERAVKIAQKALKEDPKPIWFLGSLVHNEKVIERFKKKGVKFIKRPDQAESGTLIIQAHGFPPLPKAINKKLLIRDATCPLVKKAQLLASSLFRESYKVIIVGDENHSETKGIKGYTKNKARVIENEEQAKKLPKLKKIGVIAQTTQDLEKYNHILKILKNKVDKVKYFNTVCPEVEIRQNELKSILKKVNRILVIGSRKSANTKRLVQTCKNNQKPVWWVNSLQDLKKKKLSKKSLKLGVVSGTSTPAWEIKKIRTWLRQNLDSLLY